MALVFFVDGNNDPVLTGDAYATVEQIDDVLSFNDCIAWPNLTLTEKEDKIKAMTRKIDDAYQTLYGEVFDVAQPLNFPRKGVGSSLAFGVDNQKAHLRNYIAAQIEYELLKQGIGVLQLSQGRESVVARQQITAREALASINRYRRI